MTKDELLEFAAEQAKEEVSTLPPWKILLVDDEPDVHKATKLVLKNVRIDGRDMLFSDAYSANEAKQLLRENPDYAAALVDVVMESDDAGLELVRYIRNELKNHSLRIILRTGQPGYAPEIRTIADYDINDYRAKTELTQTRLYTSLTIALRSYAQIQELEKNRIGLEKILLATRELGKPLGLKRFAGILLKQLCSLSGEGVCNNFVYGFFDSLQSSCILAADGAYSPWLDYTLEHLPDHKTKELIQRCLKEKTHQFEHASCIYIPGANGQALVAYFEQKRNLSASERSLLDVFCSNIAVAFENLQLYSSINELAYSDSLVNLPNRNAMIAALDGGQQFGLSLALVDIDSFADINSILDDSFGDAVLKAVASRLKQHFGEDVLVARLSSDLFGLFGAANKVNPSEIQQAFSAPFIIYETETLRLSATSGLVSLDNKKHTGVELLKNAGIALKQAKQLSRGKALFFKEAQSIAARDRIQLLNELRSCVEAQSLQLYFQPFVRLKDKAVIGAECLLRWITEEGKFISPEVFIPIAEQSGLIIPIGDWVMRAALTWRLSLQGKVRDDFRVAINVSHEQFIEPDFVPKILSIMAEIGVPGSQVEVELTESIAIESMELLSKKLEQLQAAEIHISMDDFGTGYSSLSVLQGLSLNRLKIDRSFVSGDAASSFNMANTIIAMAEHLNLATIAEGIETEEQCQALLEAGCQDGQGYLFAKPLPEADFLVWLKSFQ